MKIIDKYLQFVFNLSNRDFLRISAAIAFLILCSSTLLTYLFFHQKHALLRELKDIYHQRDEAQLLISKNNEIKKQKEVVSQLLEKNTNFKLIQFFDTLVDSLRLNQYVENKQLSTLDVENNTMLEISLETRINNINTKQLAELLDKIEENERVYIKKLEIRKSSKLPAVDVDLTIATLQLKSE